MMIAKHLKRQDKKPPWNRKSFVCNGLKTHALVQEGITQPALETLPKQRDFLNARLKDGGQNSGIDPTIFWSSWRRKTQSVKFDSLFSFPPKNPLDLNTFIAYIVFNLEH